MVQNRSDHTLIKNCVVELRVMIQHIFITLLKYGYINSRYVELTIEGFKL